MHLCNTAYNLVRVGHNISETIMLVADKLHISALLAIQESQAVATRISRFILDICFTTPTACLNSKGKEVSMEHIEDKTKMPISTSYIWVYLDLDSFSYVNA